MMDLEQYARPGTVSERELQTSVLRLAALYQWVSYHTHDSRRSARGFPDLVLVRGDRLILAELKTAKGQLRPDQRRWLGLLADTAAEVYLWRPQDWDEIHDTLKPEGARGGSGAS